MPAPTSDPDQRDPATIASADSYRRADPIWVYRAGAWRPGIVETVSTRAATVTYRIGTSRGTGVDTVTAAYLAVRTDADPLLNSAAAR